MRKDVTINMRQERIVKVDEREPIPLQLYLLHNDNPELNVALASMILKL